MREAKISLGFGHILEDLRLERFRRRPSNLSAQAQQEFKIDRRLLVHVDGLEVQDVRLDGKRRLAECGPVANIAHGLETSSSRGQPRHVNAEGRQQFLMRRQVHRRHQQPSSDAAAARMRAANGKRPSQHPSRATHVSGRDRCANCRA